ncbi:MAG: hypothetical protein LW804_02040 [Cryomorphaceae bacterium]|nr:hypothetical protein [Cryomorphaceae bacterium]
MQTIITQTNGVAKLTTQQKDAQILADNSMIELEALQVELEKNTNDLITLLNQ